MDLITVAAFISLEVASGFLKEHGKEIYHKVKQLLTPDELISLGLLEKSPDDQQLRIKIANALEKHLQANPNIAKEIEFLLAQLPGREIKQNTVTQTGDGNIAVQDLHKSKVNINKA